MYSFFIFIIQVGKFIVSSRHQEAPIVFFDVVGGNWSSWRKPTQTQGETPHREAPSGPELDSRAFLL